MKRTAESSRGWALLPALLVGALLRFWGLGRVALIGDEAYYWLWSRHLALSYLDKANEIAERQIAEVLESGLARPVKDKTVYGLQKPLEITREL